MRRRTLSNAQVLLTILLTSLSWFAIHLTVMVHYNMLARGPEHTDKLPSQDISPTEQDGLQEVEVEETGVHIMTKMTPKKRQPRGDRRAGGNGGILQVGVNGDLLRAGVNGDKIARLPQPVADEKSTEIRRGVKVKEQPLRRAEDTVKKDSAAKQPKQGGLLKLGEARKKAKDNQYEMVRDFSVTSLPFDPNAPGQQGKPVVIEMGKEREVNEGWRNASFNQYVSDRIPLERSLPDVRPDKCRGWYFPYNLLPKTSVIICFTEEAWSTLLRTVHSVINRSPPELIEEVLLVDDYSQRAHLQTPLDDYVKRWPNVRIIRLASRHGLIKARLRGVEESRGETLTFLDSHVECTVGWLEPLLNRIRLHKRAVASPVLDAIHDNSFQFMTALPDIWGGFDWKLMFHWYKIPKSEVKRRVSAADTIYTPVMAGGLFSIDKAFFAEIGLYDPGLEIWGGENLELSFKTWLCGGLLEIVPCSRVGHVFRKSQPYKFPEGNDNTMSRNIMRVAEVWMDEYKEFFYMKRPDLVGKPYGDIGERLELKNKLQCHSFKWYMESIYPSLELPSMDLKAKGQIYNQGQRMCIDTMSGKLMSLMPCSANISRQHFQFTTDNVIKIGADCIGRKWSSLVMVDCSSFAVIKLKHYQGGVIEDTMADECIQTKRDSSKLQLAKCQFNQPNHLWRFDTYFDKDGMPMSDS